MGQRAWFRTAVPRQVVHPLPRRVSSEGAVGLWPASPSEDLAKLSELSRNSCNRTADGGLKTGVDRVEVGRVR